MCVITGASEEQVCPMGCLNVNVFKVRILEPKFVLREAMIDMVELEEDAYM